jgi:hypothetical protein
MRRSAYAPHHVPDIVGNEQRAVFIHGDAVAMAVAGLVLP